MARQLGLTEEKIQELWDYEKSDAFTPGEKVALRFAELLNDDFQGVDDALYEELKRHFTEPEILELGFMIAMTVGGGRFVRTLNLMSWEEACALDPALAGVSRRWRPPRAHAFSIVTLSGLDSSLRSE